MEATVSQNKKNYIRILNDHITKKQDAFKNRVKEHELREKCRECCELIELSQALYLCGNYANARKTAKKTLSFAEKTFGPNHSTVADAIYALAHMCALDGQWGKAKQLYKRLENICENAPKTIQLDFEMIRSLRSLCEKQEAFMEVELDYTRLLMKVTRLNNERGLFYAGGLFDKMNLLYFKMQKLFAKHLKVIKEDAREELFKI